MQLKTPEFASREILAPLVIAANNFLYQYSGSSFDTGRKVYAGISVIDRLYQTLTYSGRVRFNEALESYFKYNPVKEFGPICIIESKATFNFFDETTQFKLKKGEPYLGIHLAQDQDSGIKGESLKAGMKRRRQKRDRGIQHLAIYMQSFREKLPSEMIVGICYERLASASERYGFQEAETPLPPEMTEKYQQRVSTIIPNLPHDISNPRICFQTVDDFLARFSVNRKNG